MKQLIPMDEHGMFADYNDTALVDSRFVADAFEKGHREVLRSIDQILSEDSGYSAEFNRCNFAPITYTDVRGRKQRCYAMTRDGFTALVMGFTGKKAARFKEFYIKRFNEMEHFIGNRASRAGGLAGQRLCADGEAQLDVGQYLVRVECAVEGTELDGVRGALR